MFSTRTTVLAAAAVATGLALWWTAGTAPAGPASDPAAPANPDYVIPEVKALALLDSVAAAHGTSIPDGVSTYAHFGKTVLAHAPLAGTQSLTLDDLVAGADLMAVFVHGDGSGRVPDGAYVVRVQYDPGSEHGTATYVDASGQDVVTVRAVLRERGDVNQLFPGAYEEEDPPVPSNIPVITSTHVWHKNRWAVDCTGPGWGWRVAYY